MTGRAPGIDYQPYARAYVRRRVADARIAARVHAALGDARTVVNVGAGTGSYEPDDRWLLAVEPSAPMRAGRPPGAAPAIDARAEALPLDDDAVDAAMAIVTIHHWQDPEAGVRELRRVARGPVVVLTFDIEAIARYWLFADYLPEAYADERERFPAPGEVAGWLGGGRVEEVPVPADCSDGFVPAYFARPEAYLDADVRAGQSIWPRLPDGVEERAVAALADDLRSGAWDARHGALRERAEADGGLRLVVAPGP